MIRRIGFPLAANIMLTLLVGVIVFHVLVLAEVIPYNIVWGGRLKSPAEMRRFEFVSIAINILVISAVAMKGGYIKAIVPARVVDVSLWLLTALFALNTIGNMFSKTSFETIVFTPLTLVSAVLCYRLALEKRT